MLASPTKHAEDARSFLSRDILLFIADLPNQPDVLRRAHVIDIAHLADAMNVGSGLEAMLGEQAVLLRCGTLDALHESRHAPSPEEAWRHRQQALGFARLELTCLKEFRRCQLTRESNSAPHPQPLPADPAARRSGPPAEPSADARSAGASANSSAQASAPASTVASPAAAPHSPAASDGCRSAADSPGSGSPDLRAAGPLADPAADGAVPQSRAETVDPPDHRRRPMSGIDPEAEWPDRMAGPLPHNEPPVVLHRDSDGRRPPDGPVDAGETGDADGVPATNRPELMES